MNMRLEVFDFQFNRLGLIEKYTTVQYTEKYADIGEFELDCPIDKNNIDLIKKDRIIWFEEDVAGIVQYVDKVIDEDTKLSVKGKLIVEILSWRWLFPCFMKTANPVEIMRSMVNTHCINPTDIKRKYQSLEVDTTVINMSSVTFQKTGETVTDGLIKISNANDLGFKISFNPKNQNKLQFKVLKGTDRTSGLNKVIFSQDLNNIVNGEYTYNDESYRNVALIVGEAVEQSEDSNDNANRRKLEVFENGKESVSGFERRELYVDARDLQSEYSVEEDVLQEDGTYEKETVEKTMPDSEYNSNLSQRGNEKLAEAVVLESYSGEIRTDSQTMFRYRRDYFLGDKVIVYDKDIGISINAIVTEMQITNDAKGYTYEPTFGYGLPTIIKKVKTMI